MSHQQIPKVKMSLQSDMRIPKMMRIRAISLNVPPRPNRSTSGPIDRQPTARPHRKENFMLENIHLNEWNFYSNHSNIFRKQKSSANEEDFVLNVLEIELPLDVGIVFETKLIFQPFKSLISKFFESKLCVTCWFSWMALDSLCRPLNRGRSWESSTWVWGKSRWKIGSHSDQRLCLNFQA